jgi:hypothetical protein
MDAEKDDQIGIFYAFMVKKTVLAKKLTNIIGRILNGLF